MLLLISLSILFMRFLHSSWWTTNFHMTSFNSLYEIPRYIQRKRPHGGACFQFSLWDSLERTLYRKRKIQQLSILFMRFEAFATNFSLSNLTTLSILFMRFQIYLLMWKHKQIIFQFSLWDSFSDSGLEGKCILSTFNSLYEIQKTNMTQ